MVAVARQGVVLAFHAQVEGSFDRVAAQCLAKAPAAAGKVTYTADRYNFNLLVEGGYRESGAERGFGGGKPAPNADAERGAPAEYLVVSSQGMGREVPYAFLARVEQEFQTKFGVAAASAPEGTLTRQFGPRLRQHMETLMNNPAEVSKLSKVSAQVAEVKSVMIDNIEKVLDRGEKIELLVDKTEQLRFTADNFSKSGKKLRRHMWCQNLKMKVILFLIVAAVILVIFLIACYGSGKNCTKRG